MTTNFVHLHLHTNRSLLRGTGGVGEHVARAKALGFDALALTDTNGLYGLVAFIREARGAGIKPIVGAEIRHTTGRAVCLARNLEGYRNLSRLVTARLLQSGFSLPDALIARQGGLCVLVRETALLARLAGKLEGERLFRELTPFDRPETLPPGLRRIRPVATNAVHFPTADHYGLHRIVTAIRLNTLLARTPAHELAPPGAWLKGPDDMATAFKKQGAHDAGTLREAFANTRRIAEACNLDLPMGTPVFPRFFELEDVRRRFTGETPYSALCRVAFRGARRRYRPLTPKVMKRLEYELDVINKLGFSEYFLIVWDIVNFALRKKIPIVGRGSAANSLVAYTLGITGVDPLHHNLYFERFLNLSRGDCPDIDLDIDWRRRDEVLAYVYERYGDDRVAMVCNHNTFQSRSAFRDAARVMGLPMDEINRLSRKLPHYGGRAIRAAVELYPEAADFPLDEEPWATCVRAAEALDGAPRHLSIHNGGIVIGDRPLADYVPLERATKGLVITQLEKDAIEALGLVKIDLLGHRSLAVIADTVDALERDRGLKIDPRRIRDGDAKTADTLRKGRTIGCFQLESPGMRSLLQMVRARNRCDVVHALSLIRPGPSASGMKERFVRRRLGE
jgi:DNA polymerase III alpha subunit